MIKKILLALACIVGFFTGLVMVFAPHWVDDTILRSIGAILIVVCAVTGYKIYVPYEGRRVVDKIKEEL